MNASRGIFEQSPPTESNGHVNPFSFAAEAPINNPFAAAPMVPHSPFAAIPDMAQDRLVPEPGKPAKIPAPRGKMTDSPFQVAAENGNHFGFEPAAVSPFAVAAAAPAVETLHAPVPMQNNPFSIHREAPAPATLAPAAPAPTPVAAAASAFGAWPQAAPAAPAPAVSNHIFQPEETPVYRQLELRAIFGVDREMSGDEILQRTRSLPGIKHVARIDSHEVNAMESLKRTLQSLGFGNGNIRLYSGSVPIEFVRDGGTILAVQTDGGFAPGIRETIMIVARELDKMGSV